LPHSDHFHPARIHGQSGISTLARAVPLISVTLVRADPAPGYEWLASIEPIDTRLFLLHNPTHVRWLREWLSRATHLLGHNINYDRSFLRYFGLRSCLPLGIPIIDTTILNYLDNDARPERSLKDLGPVFNIYSYSDSTLRSGSRFPSPHSPEAQHYCAQDSHNVVLLARALTRSIISKHGPSSPKLSASAASFYSATLDIALTFIESGIPLSASALSSTLSDHLTRADAAAAATLTHGLTLNGEGSTASRQSFIDRAIDEIDSSPDILSSLNLPTILSHRLINRTGTGKVSTDDNNRTLLLSLLSPTSPLRPAFTEWTSCSRLNKVISTYLYPLLHGSRNPRSDGSRDTTSVAIKPPTQGVFAGGYDPDVLLAYPSIFVTPSQEGKDSTAGDSGGQSQVRLSFKKPAAQTFPPVVKKCLRSRYRGGSIVSHDLSQIELRVPGVLSGEPTLITEYQLPKPDLHTKRAVFVFGPSILSSPDFKCGDMRKDPRQWAKKLNFSDLYWAFAKRMQASMLKDTGRLFPFDFFLSIVRSRPTLRPVLYDWQCRLIADTRRLGHITLPFTGAGRSFTDFDPTNEDQAYITSEVLNCPIQTTAATVQRAIEHAALSSKEARSLLSHGLIAPFLDVHDACYTDCHPSALSAYLALYQDAVERIATTGYWSHICEHYGHYVPLVAECTIHAST
ncbi:MAG: DNA polymerase, partial [Acetobacteraceae bacterium]